MKNSVVKAIGACEHGQMVGEWTWGSKSGNIIEVGPFNHGVQSRRWTRNHENGTPEDEGEYVNDKKSGEWKVFNPDGNLIKAMNYPTK